MSITYIVGKDEITSTPPRHSLEDTFISGDIRYRKYFAENLITTGRVGYDCSIVAYAFAEDISYLEARLRMGNHYRKDWGTHRETFRQFLRSHGYPEKRFLFQITLAALWATGFFTDKTLFTSTSMIQIATNITVLLTGESFSVIFYPVRTS